MRGFDPKWADVVISTRFSGASGQTVTCNDKSNQRFVSVGCSISDHPAFDGGALRFVSSGSASYVYSTAAPIYPSDNLFEIDFVLESLGATGLRGLVRDGLGCMTCRIDVTTASIEFGIRASSSDPWSMLTCPIGDVDAFIGIRHALRCQMTASQLSMELDGVVIGVVGHGVSSMPDQLNNFAIGNASTSAAHSWIGWIGQFRWTRALRSDEMGLPLPDRFPILGALDQYREKVVAHCHYDGRYDAREAIDTLGDPVIFTGAAALKDDFAKFGISSASLGGGTIYQDGIDFSAQKFTVEWWVLRATNNGISYPIATIANPENSAAAVGLSAPYGGPVALSIGGVGVENGVGGAVGPSVSWRHFALVRDGEYLAVFVAGTRALLYNIGPEAIQSSGRLVFGPSPDWIDEHRVTIGEARYNVQASAVVAPTERFNEYGPRALSGIVRNPDGTPRPNTLVRCYHRVSGRLVSQAYSDAGGAFVLPTSDTSPHSHFWVAHHPGANAMIRDHITPALIGS